MVISTCKINHIVNPLGFMMKRVTASWIVEDTPSKKQAAAQIKVAHDPDMKNIVYDSGKDSEISSLAAELPLELVPYTRYYWKVKVWGDTGDTAESAVNWFETGKMSDTWHGKWITPSWEDKEIHPYMRKAFSLSGNVKSACAYVTGMGLYHLEVNGKRAGNECLTPYCNAYDSWVQCQTFDITDMLQSGDNAIGAMLGNGWAKGRFGLSFATGTSGPIYCDSFALLCELRIEMENGGTVIVGSDDSWKCATSPVTFSGIYDGESYDANIENKNWSAPGFDDSSWDKVKPFDPSALGDVVDRLSPPVLVKDIVKPKALIETPAGESVIDMGQNMVGWLKFKLREPKGTKIKLTYAEVMQDGNFYTENLRSAKQEYTYISDGSEKSIEPLFTFYGFQYVKLEGFSDINLEDFEGCVIYSDMEQIGTIETSDPLVNRLFLNALWGQKGNFVDVPTDCPQRDERLGWTGDTQVFAGTASFNMDTYAFYAKYMHDLYEEQKGSDGMVHHFVPSIVPKSRRKEVDALGGGGGALAWADCATIVPWEVYLHSGDKGILADQFDSMKDWVDWIKKENDAGLWTTRFHFGDWLALDGPGGSNPMGGTDNDFLAMAFYKYSAEITAKAAKILGRGKDAEYYGELSEQVKKAIWDEFFSKNGRITVRTQTAYIIALHFNLVPDSLRARIFKDFLALMIKDNMHLKTGFVGTPYLCRVLSENGASESAYQVFFQEDYPSWLYAVKLGATTIWERWNTLLPDGKISDTGMNSLNHYSYGSIIEWVYRHVCGLRPCYDAPGFKKFAVIPEVYGKLKYAKAAVRTASGLAESGWRLEKDGTLTVSVKVPFDAEAAIYLPDANLSDVDTKGLKAVQEGTYVKIAVDAGEFSFNYRPTRDYTIRCSTASPLADILENEAAKKILFEMFPQLAERRGGAYQLPYSIDSMTDMMKKMAFGTTDFTELNEQLNKISVPIREV